MHLLGLRHAFRFAAFILHYSRNSLLGAIQLHVDYDLDTGAGITSPFHFLQLSDGLSDQNWLGGN